MYKRNWFALIFSTDYHVLITFHCVFHLILIVTLLLLPPILLKRTKNRQTLHLVAKATTIDIERYRTLTFELLKNINLLPAITCDDCNCKSAEHKLQIDQFYMQLCAVLEKASRDCIPSFTVDSFRDYMYSFLI